MLALGDSAQPASLPHWLVLSSVSPSSIFCLFPACSFSLNARGVNVLLGNIHEGFLELRSYCQRVSGIFFTRVLFEDVYLNGVLEFSI